MEEKLNVCARCDRQLPLGAVCCPWCGKPVASPHTPKKRGNGQGTAIRRGKTWTAIWTEDCYLSNGQYRQGRKSLGGFPTKTAALAYAADPHPDRKVAPTLRDYWSLWEKGGYLKLSKSKQSAYRTAWAKLEELAGRRMDALVIEDLQGCINKKAPTYYPAKDMKTVLSHLFELAVAEGNARTNLSNYITLPALDEDEGEPFTEVELHKIWNAYGAGELFLGFVLLMIYTGMMPGELMKCKADMIDWEKREIRGCGIKTKKRKTADIVFPDMIVPVLAALVEASPSRLGYIIGMNKDKFYDVYHETVRRIGIRDLPPYSCRHTTATALALGDIAPSVIQKVMRHTKFSTTQRYIHPDNAASHAAVNTMGRGKAIG